MVKNGLFFDWVGYSGIRMIFTSNLSHPGQGNPKSSNGRRPDFFSALE